MLPFSMMFMVLIFILVQVWAATESGNLEVTYTHREEQVQDPTILHSSLHPVYVVPLLSALLPS